MTKYLLFIYFVLIIINPVLEKSLLLINNHRACNALIDRWCHILLCHFHGSVGRMPLTCNDCLCVTDLSFHNIYGWIFPSLFYARWLFVSHEDIFMFILFVFSFSYSQRWWMLFSLNRETPFNYHIQTLAVQPKSML